jgi:hypothetical protein
LGRKDGTTEIAWQWRPKAWHVTEDTRIVARQAGKTVGHIVVIGAVAFFGCWSTRAILLQGPQHSSRDENERECRDAGQDLSRQARDRRTFWTQAQ